MWEKIETKQTNRFLDEQNTIYLQQHEIFPSIGGSMQMIDSPKSANQPR
jgi:hypothetical protein